MSNFRGRWIGIQTARLGGHLCCASLAMFAAGYCSAQPAGGGAGGAGGGAAQSSTPATSITIVGRVADGTTVISGVTQASASLEIVDAGTGTIVSLQNSAISASAEKNGLITFNLTEPLYAGQKLEFWNPGGAAVFIGDPNGKVKDLEVKLLGDWGRVRAEFTFGAVMSFNNNFELYSTPSSSSSSGSSSTNNSQATLFLSFNLDKNWRWTGVKTIESVSTPTATKPDFKLTSRYLFDTFFQTRLTSVPVTVCVPSSSTSSSSSGSSSANSCSSAAASGGTGALSTFLNSAKSAELEVGAYMPILTNVWSYQGTPNALFIAPLAKLGFITPTGSTTSGSTTAQPVNNSNFYNFYGYGGRVGHVKLSSDKDVSPELISYLDVMLGRFSNLETLEAKPSGIGYVRGWRLAVEGALKVPQTPLIIGVSANIGQNLHGPVTVQAAKDDLRFFIGARFDVGRVLSKLPSL